MTGNDVRQAENASALALIEYTPDGHLGFGLAAWREMVDELVKSRELVYRLFLRDFTARYRQSVLGVVWAVLPVVMTVGVFWYLNRAAILPVQKTALPYPLYVLLGTTVWQVFASGLTAATQSLVSAGNLITKINFPRETLVFAAFGQSLVEFGIRVVLICLGFLIWQVTPHWTIILVPVVLLPLCLLTVGVGFITALANGVMRDVGQIVTALLMFGMFLAPVVYPPATAGPGKLLTWLNPVSPFLIATQDLATRGVLSHPVELAVSSAVGVLAFLLGWRVFHLTEPRIAERV